MSHRTQIGELKRQFRESECKFLVENAELQQRVDSLQSKLFTLQTDRDPNTPVSKLQEQVTRTYLLTNLQLINLNHAKTRSPGT